MVNCLKRGLSPSLLETPSMKYKRKRPWYVGMLQNYWILQNGLTNILYKYDEFLQFWKGELTLILRQLGVRCKPAGGGNQQRNLPGWQEQNVRALRKHRCVAVVLPKVLRWRITFQLSGHMLKLTSNILDLHSFLPESCRKICISGKKEFSTFKHVKLFSVNFGHLKRPCSSVVSF